MGNSQTVQVIEQGYVKHHLHVARFQRVLFGEDFIARVYDPTEGVASKIDTVCRSALILGATESRQILEKTDLR